MAGLMGERTVFLPRNTQGVLRQRPVLHPDAGTGSRVCAHQSLSLCAPKGFTLFCANLKNKSKYGT